MKPGFTASSPGRQALADAATWFVEFRVGEVDAAAREEFNRWVRRSPENIEAYLQIATTWADLPAAKPDGNVDIAQLVAGARGASNVVSLESAERAAPLQEIREEATPSRSRRLPLLLAASVVCACIGIAFAMFHRSTAYSTGIGEQRYVTLKDGSTVELNARSRLRVRFSDRERTVDLIEGQALFGIAKDPQRPFVVNSGTTRIRAVGTQFDVYRRASGTTVTVLEGRVAVSAPATPTHEVRDAASSKSAPHANGARDGGSRVKEPRNHEPIMLSAGEQLVVKPSAQLAPVPANLDAATAWTQRRLVFESSRLADVVEEFNRYNQRPLLVDDEALHEMRISGVYSSTDPASLLRFLRHQPGVEVIEEQEGIRIAQQ